MAFIRGGDRLPRMIHGESKEDRPLLERPRGKKPIQRHPGLVQVDAGRFAPRQYRLGGGQARPGGLVAAEFKALREGPARFEKRSASTTSEILGAADKLGVRPATGVARATGGGADGET
jgi:hypothetical protein